MTERNWLDEFNSFWETGPILPGPPPWDQATIDRLNAQQHSGMVHPFTCGGDRTDEKHLDGEGILVATPEGWKCPYCDYTQR